MMTSDELTDLRVILATQARIERKVDDQGARLDKLERFADKAEGALTLVKFTASVIGLGGLAAFVAYLSRTGG